MLLRKMGPAPGENFSGDLPLGTPSILTPLNAPKVTKSKPKGYKALRNELYKAVEPSSDEISRDFRPRSRVGVSCTLQEEDCPPENTPEAEISREERPESVIEGLEMSMHRPDDEEMDIDDTVDMLDPEKSTTPN